MRKWISLLVVVLALACSKRSETPLPEARPKPQPKAATTTAPQMPAYKARNLDGSEFDLQAKKGTVLLLNLWATWCGPCRHEIPELEKVHAKYNSRGFAVVGISVDESVEAVPDWLSARARSGRKDGGLPRGQRPADISDRRSFGKDGVAKRRNRERVGHEDDQGAGRGAGRDFLDFSVPPVRRWAGHGSPLARALDELFDVPGHRKQEKPQRYVGQTDTERDSQSNYCECNESRHLLL
jgi:thiol-disulfide isomerase/thioredoxin